LDLSVGSNPVDIGFGLNKYPDPFCTELRQELSGKIGVPFDQILVTNGADEVILLLSLAFLEPGKNITLKNPTFSLYRFCAKVMGAEIVANEDENTRLVVFCSPNNPTGTVLKTKELEKIIKNSNSLVIIDEVYSTFSKEEYLPLLKYPNVLLINSFSKEYSLAGARVGYILGSEEIISKVYSIKNALMPFSVSAGSQKIALKALKQGNSEMINKFSELKEYFYQKLQKISGIKVQDSSATFFLIEFLKAEASGVYSKLKKRGILTKKCEIFGLNGNYLRVSVPGSKADADFFIKILKDLLKMKILPAIDLMDGKAVQLECGDPSKVKYSADPFEKAKEFSQAETLWIVDLNAALGTGSNLGIIKQLLSKYKCYVGGGIRTKEIADELLQAGAEKICIGTRALEDPSFLDQFDSEKIIIALDFKNGKLQKKGWTEEAEFPKLNAKYYLITNVSMEGLEQGPDFEFIQKAIAKYPNAIISGGISSKDDVLKIKSMGAYAAVIGSALYSKKLKLKEVLKI